MTFLERRVAIDAARTAGRLLLNELSGSRRISYKGTPTNLVTEVDVRAEALLAERIHAACAADAILAEEGGARPGRSGRRWIVDPLDGTTNYAHGVPLFAVSIALEVDQRIALGVVYDPNHDELFVAERGGGAFLGDERLAVSTTAGLGESPLATGLPYTIRETTHTHPPAYAALRPPPPARRPPGSPVPPPARGAAGGLLRLRGPPR